MPGCVLLQPVWHAGMLGGPALSQPMLIGVLAIGAGNVNPQHQVPHASTAKIAT